MANTLEFRTLRADEIEVRIDRVNKGGVKLLLYKNARADQTILDETVGVFGWQRHHLRDNANCIVSIWDPDKKQWVEKEDVGMESTEYKDKGLASDSFKRACFNLGIGRELYTAPAIFIPKAKLNAFDEENQKCANTFVVNAIEYDSNRRIKTVTIGICNYGKQYDQLTIGCDNPTVQIATKAMFPEDEIILFGNCKGKRYGDVKNTAVFKSFINWVHNSSASYTDEKVAAQYKKLKELEVSNG